MLAGSRDARKLHQAMPACPFYPRTNGITGKRNWVHVYKIMNGYGGQLENKTFVIRTADDAGDSVGTSSSAGWLFPDQTGLEYCRRGHYNRYSTAESLGNFVCSRARLLDREQ